jgi:signal peptidase I
MVASCACCAIVVVRCLAPRRFVVADRSMEPTLVDGQGLVGVKSSPARIGQLRTFEHPDRPGFWLIKRVTAVSGDSMIVESDNRDVQTEDSRSFGPVDVDGSYRVVVRVPSRWM